MNNRGLNNRGLNELEFYFFFLYRRSKGEQSEGGLIAPTSTNTQATLSVCFSILCIDSHSQAKTRPKMAVEAPAIIAVFQKKYLP